MLTKVSDEDLYFNGYGISFVPISSIRRDTKSELSLFPTWLVSFNKQPLVQQEIVSPTSPEQNQMWIGVRRKYIWTWTGKHRPLDRPTNLWTDPLSHQPIHRNPERYTDTSINWPTDSLTIQPSFYLTDNPTHTHTHWLTDTPTNRPSTSCLT